jgi:DNA-binding response OmpR family regulator
MKGKILIAEDEPHILELIKFTLSDSFEILEAEDGEQALKVIEENKDNPPDLVLLDVMMPRMNGYEVCEKLKSNTETKDIIITMLSAKGQIQERMEGMRKGADHYITKPFDPIALKEQLEIIVNKKNRRDKI